MILSYMTYNYIILLTLCNIVLLFYNRGRQGKRKADLVAYIILMMMLALGDFIEPMLMDPMAQYLVYFFCCAGRTILILLLVYNLTDGELPENLRWVMESLAVVNTVGVYLSLKTGWFLNVTTGEDGRLVIHRTLLSGISTMITLFYMGVLFWNLWRKKDLAERKGIAILAVFTVECVTSYIFDMLMENRILFLPAVCISMLIYSLFEDMQAAKQQELEKSYQLKMKQQELMLSQIHPHFLYNTLGNIRYLVRTDPDKAEESLNDLALYLRANVHSTQREEIVPFETEIENTRLFVKIEQLRFPESRVEYDLKDMDFMIPVLSVQPMVENAMKHGIRTVKDGCVTVTSYFKDEKHYVEIADNGTGFDTGKADYHVGIQNVKERLEMICHGSLQIASTDKGTRVILCIPEDDEE